MRDWNERNGMARKLRRAMGNQDCITRSMDCSVGKIVEEVDEVLL